MKSDAQLKVLIKGSVCVVAMLPNVLKQFEVLHARPRASLVRAMELYSQGRQLPDTMFKHEARLPVGNDRGTNVQVCAFKAFAVRVYGARLNLRLDGIECAGVFVCSEIDTAKKQDKAVQGKLRRAAQNLLSLIEEERANQ